MNNLTNFIRLVLSQSKLAMEKGEIPVASLIVDPIDERVIAKSFNQEIALNDPTAHAEILSIRKACKKLNQKRLDGLVMIKIIMTNLKNFLRKDVLLILIKFILNF